MDNGLIISLMTLCLMLEAFYAGSEIAVVSADRLKLRHMAAKGSRGAQLALDMLEKPEWLLSTTLVGINIAIVTNTSLATILAINLFGPEQAWMAIVMVAPLIWVFGEIVPKSVFQQKADTITPKVIYILKASSILFYPVLLFFTQIVRVITSLAGSGQKESAFTLREEIDLMLQMPAMEGDIQPIEKSMIRRLFNFSETRVRDIMLPLIDVAVVEIGATCGQTLQIAGDRSHARLLVYSQRTPLVVGMINTIELLGLPREAPIKPHVKPVRFVPGSKNIEELLREFRKDGDRLAAVVDEFGSAQGIITIEDIMERVVGRLRDEYDSGEKVHDIVRRVDGDTFVVPGRISLVALRDELNISLPDGNYETLAGFLLERLEEIPQEGFAIELHGHTFTVTRTNRKAIKEVRISK